MRDYGLSKSEPAGIPTWEKADIECPNCGAILCFVKVDVTNDLVKGGKGVAHYLGCPACPFAGPAAVIASATV